MSALSTAAAHHPTQGGPWPRTAPPTPALVLGFPEDNALPFKRRNSCSPSFLGVPPKHKVLGTGQ